MQTEYPLPEALESLEEAVARLQGSPGLSIPIHDPHTGQVVAVLSRPGYSPPPVAPRLGGMATPLGVYLTDGAVHGGAGHFGLFLTGVVLSVLALLAQEAVRGLLSVGALHGIYPQVWIDSHYCPSLLRAPLSLGLEWLPAPLIFVLLRLIPMSGTHAAEHQAVHCVEKRLPLTQECVRSQPRVHPRCGTNLFVGLSLFLLFFVSVFSSARSGGQDTADAATLGLIAAAIPTLLLWRRVGGFFQQWLATRPATDAQIGGAIRAAEEVLCRRRRSAPILHFRVLRRIWNMGFLQVLLGYFAVYGPLVLAMNHWPRLGSWLGY